VSIALTVVHGIALHHGAHSAHWKKQNNVAGQAQAGEKRKPMVKNEEREKHQPNGFV